MSVRKGFIYKISSKEYGDDRVYIGQVNSQTKKQRWSGHLTAAKEQSGKANYKLKAAKLHQAINLFGQDNMVMEILETFEFSDKNQLLNKLDARENHFIKKYDSINNGWNKVFAPTRSRPLGVLSQATLKDQALLHGVGVRQLYHETNKNNRSVEEAIKIIKERPKKVIEQYSYGKQIYKSIRELADSHNENEVLLTTLKNRIRDLKKDPDTRVDFDLDSNTKTIYVKPLVFRSVREPEEVSVETPRHGEQKGSIQDLHRRLLKLYPDLVPDSYTTVQARMGKTGWTSEQAFGFRYPHGLEEIEDLIVNQDYQWGEIDGVSKIPDFRTGGLKTKVKPIILRTISVVYLTEADWCKAYKLTDRKTIKSLFDEGYSPEQVLSHYKRVP